MQQYQELLVPAIIVIVPALIGLLKVASVAIPKPVIPVLVIGLGATLQLGAAYVTDSALSPTVAAAYGSASIGLRELIDQLNKLRKQAKPV